MQSKNLYLTNFLESSHSFEQNEILLKYKFRVLNVLMLVAAIFPFLFFLLSILNINPLGTIHTITNVLLSMTSFFLVVRLRLSKKLYTQTSYILFAAAFLSFTSALLFVQNDEFRMVWFYLLVVAVYITGDIKTGDIISFLSAACLIVISVFYELNLSQIAITSIVVGLLILSLFLRSYAKKILDFERELIEKENFIISELEKRVFLEVEKNREHEQTLIEQSRRVQMGELIAMIAHQWRQPLSTISATSINMRLKIELGKIALTDEDKEYTLNRFAQIDSMTQEMSTTIDDFRNFYITDKKAEFFNLEDVVDKSLKIIAPMISDGYIDVTTEYVTPKILEGFENELMQVVLNILQNSYDNFKGNSLQNKYIKIKIDEKILTICDNGGGIPENIIGNIFDPYFSTKDKKNGSGLGLYMSKIIVETHHDGDLSVINTDDGACFKIELLSR